MSCLALAGAHHLEVSRATEQVRQTIASVPGATVRTIDVDLIGGRIRLDGLVLAGTGRRVTIGHLEAPLRSRPGFGLMAEALAQSGGASADDIRIELDKAIVSIPHLKAEGTTLSDTDLAGIFDPKQPGTLEDRLAKLSARSLSAPELKIAPRDAEIAAKNGAFTIRNIVLSDVDAGKIKVLSADGASIGGGTAPDTTATIEIGKITASGLDVPLGVKIIEGARTDAAATLAPLYDAFSIASIKFTETAPETQSFEIGAIEGSGLKARPLLVPIAEYKQRLEQSRADTASDDDRARASDLTVDALKSVVVGRLALRDIKFSQTGTEKPVSLTVATIGLDASDVLQIGSFAVESVAMTTPDADVTLARFAIEGLDQSGLPDAIKQNGALPGLDASLDEMQALAPKVSKVSLAALHVQAPAKTQDGNSADGNAYIFDVPVVELKIGGYSGHMATDATSRIQVIYDVAPTVPNPGLKQLVNSGFGHLDVTTDTGLTWAPDKHVFKLDRLGFAAKDLATLFLNGAMSNVSADVFGTDETARAVALQQVKVDALEIGFANQGLIDKALPILAAQAQMTVPAFKTDLKLKFHQLVLETLGETAAATQIVRAGSAFIDKPKSFDLKIAAPHGIGMTEVGGAANPKDLLGLVTITATANQ